MEGAEIRRLLEKATARGILSAADAHEAARRHAEILARGGRPDFLEVVREVTGLDPLLLESLDDTSLVGRTLGGFKILAKIGEGGMGAVYRALQTSLGREVALKVLDPTLAYRPDFAARFRREARAAALLDHPNIVQPIDFGEDAGFLFFAMEFMEGGSASARLAERGAFAENEAIEVGIAIARALEYAEQHRIVHRDVKPGNILFSKHGTAKLGDLGLVLERDERSQLTDPSIAMGTPDYMPPEQARGERDLDVRADIYSLGVTLFELRAGRRPYLGPDPVAVITQHLTLPVPDLREAAPGASEALALVLRRAMAKRREDRFASARELREALEAAARGERPAGAAAPRPTRRAAAIAALFFGAIALAGFLTWAVEGGARTPAPDLRAEAEAAARAIDLLLARRSTDGGYGFYYDQPSDPWTTAQGFAALAIADRPPKNEDLRRLLARIRETRLDSAGWPVQPAPRDNVACTEVTAWVGIALALAGERFPEAGAADRRAVRDWLLAVQTEGGGFPSIPAGGAETVRTSATVLALESLVLLEARDARSVPPSAAIDQAARWLARHYDREQGAWFPNPVRSGWGNRQVVRGLSEFAIYALIEAEELLRAGGRALPAEAREVVSDFARRLAPVDLDPWALAHSQTDDYYLALPAGRRTSLGPIRWVWFAWRLLAAERLSKRADTPRSADWRAEAARLRARIPEIPKALADLPPFEVAEITLAVNALRRRAAGDPRAGSLYALVSEG